MKKHYKFSIWYFIIGIWIVLLMQNYLASTFAVKTIPYSEFIEYLEQGKVHEVAITANEIQGRIKEEGEGDQDQYFKTVRVDPKFRNCSAPIISNTPAPSNRPSCGTYCPGCCRSSSFSGSGSF